MIKIRELTGDDALAVTSLYLKNRENLRPFEPLRDEMFFTVDYQRRLLSDEGGAAYRYGIFYESKLIGRITLSRITRAAFQNAGMGYWLDADYRSQGIMTAAVQEVIRRSFEELGFHRLEASVMPRNSASLRVLHKCGFELIGLARKYLQINGNWEDHQIYQLINDK